LRRDRQGVRIFPSRGRHGVPMGLQPTNSDEKHARLR
jgi:hypothetical protein